jgi:hypothetical protein
VDGILTTVGSTHNNSSVWQRVIFTNFFLVLIPIKKWEFPLGAMNLYL